MLWSVASLTSRFLVLAAAPASSGRDAAPVLPRLALSREDSVFEVRKRDFGCYGQRPERKDTHDFWWPSWIATCVNLLRFKTRRVGEVAASELRVENRAWNSSCVSTQCHSGCLSMYSGTKAWEISPLKWVCLVAIILEDRYQHLGSLLQN